MKEFLLSILILTVLVSCKSTVSDDSGKKEIINLNDSRAIKQNTIQPRAEIIESNINDSMDIAFREKVFNKMNDIRGYNQFEPRFIKARIIKKHSPIFDNNILLFEINYESELCWHPIDLFFLDKDSSYLNSINIGCTKCGCESTSEVNYTQIDDSTYKFAETETVHGADTSEVTEFNYVLRVNRDLSFDTLNWESITYLEAD